MNRVRKTKEMGMMEEKPTPSPAPAGPPAQAPMGQDPMNQDVGADQQIMEVLGNLQEAISQLSMRMDKIENQPVENEEQEVPEAPQTNEVPKMESNGGDNEAGDLDAMDNKGKYNGSAQNPENIMQELMSRMESMMKKMEDLRGVPEVPHGKKEQPIGPNATKAIPATKQPANGKAPSGGGFDSDDKTAEDESSDAEGELKKPKKDYSKPSVSYNTMSKEAAPGEDLPGSKSAEGVEGESEDPSKPQPGKTEEKPEPMDMKNPMEKLYEKIRGELAAEALTKRQSTIISNNVSEKHQERLKNQQAASQMVREYMRML